MLVCHDCDDFIKEDRGDAMRHIMKKHRKKIYDWYKSKGKIKLFPSKEDSDELIEMFFKTTVK